MRGTWLKVNMLTNPAHFHVTSQQAGQKILYNQKLQNTLNLFMKSINPFTETSQLLVGQYASFNQV